MALSKTDYIVLVGNLTRVGTALNIMRDVLPDEGTGYGVTEAEQQTITSELMNIQARLFGIISKTENKCND